jgi:hypothetical protein
MPAPLIATQANLQNHFERIGQILSSAVDVNAKVFMDVDWTLSPIAGGLIGEGCEFISRNRGLRVPVAPLLHLQRGLWAWLGYREEWDDERPNRNVRRFSFRSAGMTIHFGWKADLFKPQIFRAEWAGWAKWSGDGDYTFQAADAGHPHWQFDALDSLPASGVTERAALLREKILKSGIDPVMRDFVPQFADDDIRDVVTVQKISRLHFASAAAWWMPTPQNTHAHSPGSTSDVEEWVRLSLAYLGTELERLQAA